MVVVIEEETTRVEEEEVKETRPEVELGDDGGSEKVSKEALDGFETASDGDLDLDDDKEGHSVGQPSDGGEEEIAPPPPPTTTTTKTDAFEDALNDDELNQRALAQANDAKVEGNALFKDGQYEDALSKYEAALQVAPEIPSAAELRSICHSNRAVCFLKLGKYQETIKECTKSLELNPGYMKALVRRAEANEKLEHYDEAIADNKKILELDPSDYNARRSIVRLEPLARKKTEKMKEEMIGKLKDLGNSVLGRFGMSVDNFKVVTDPKTGSSTIQYQQ